jgi:hypothetical protein
MTLMILPLMLVTTLQRVLAPAMGQKVVHCGEVGTGQIAKLCNNLILGITMAGVAEAFQMGKALGIDPKKLAEVVNTSSGRYASRTSTGEAIHSLGPAFIISWYAAPPHKRRALATFARTHPIFRPPLPAPPQLNISVSTLLFLTT